MESDLIEGQARPPWSPVLAWGLWAIAHSFFDFFLGWALIVSSIVGIVAAVPVWRGPDSEDGRARMTLVASGLLLVILAAVGAVATLTTKWPPTKVT